ncbi:hypothetical protein EGR_08865 [Echinococcus granulosus]|uniref:Uncharacterized protein n=1 Tax=Echinococcus granulosus TaxID=6210 RepID=W6U5B4_ECHGR|nr:hypothetical protein EGR_08865 [Echinococcus granulosus]EUB56320.1 hypothetical protein EGR_08865 [Echinococcus granulosus]
MDVQNGSIIHGERSSQTEEKDEFEATERLMQVMDQALLATIRQEEPK